MSTAPQFFVPASTPESQEEVYAQMAQSYRAEPLPMAERIYSISFEHDGDHWTATIGESLRGLRRRTSGRGSQRREIEEKLADPAIVLAIFSGNPYLVLTDGRPVTAKVSAWANPFMAGRPSSVRLFSLS